MHLRFNLPILTVLLLLALSATSVQAQWLQGNTVEIAGNDNGTPSWQSPGTPRTYPAGKKPLLSIRAKTQEGGRWVLVPSIRLKELPANAPQALIDMRDDLDADFPWLTSWQFSAQYGQPATPDMSIADGLAHVNMHEVVSMANINTNALTIGASNQPLSVHPETIKRMVSFLTGPYGKHFGLAALDGQTLGRVFETADAAWAANLYGFGHSPLTKVWLSAESGQMNVDEAPGTNPSFAPARFLDIRGVAEAALMLQAPPNTPDATMTDLLRYRMPEVEKIGYDLSVLVVFVAWDTHLTDVGIGVLEINSGLDLGEIPSSASVGDIEFDMAHAFNASFSLSGTGIDVDPPETLVVAPAPREASLHMLDTGGTPLFSYVAVPHSVGDWVEVSIPTANNTYATSIYFHPPGDPGFLVFLPIDYDQSPEREWIITNIGAGPWETTVEDLKNTQTLTQSF